MKWRIYYGDGSTFSDRDGSPFEAPRTNVQAIAYEAGKAVHLTHSRDAYFWTEDYGWTCGDQLGLWDYLMSYRGPQSVLFGRTLRDDDFWKIVGRASKEGVGDLP